MQNTSFIRRLDQPIAINSLKEQVTTNSAGYFLQERLSRFEIIWVQEGCWAMQVNGYPLQLATQTACILIPGQLRFAAIAANIKGFHISISEEYFHLAASQGLHKFYYYNFLDRPWLCRLDLDKERSALLELILSAMQQESMGETAAHRDIMLGWLKVLFAYFDSGSLYEQLELPARRNQEISMQFFKLLAHSFTTQKKVAYYAQSLAITPTHLNQVIKKVSGYPASYHIQRCIIMEAKRLALNGAKTMKEISYSLGFDDVSHFSKFFKNNAGMSFSGFIKQVPGD